MTEKISGRLLRVRNAAKKKRPAFLRQNWFKKPRVGIKWRSPKGIHNKMREGQMNHGRRPESGYRSPVAARGLTPEGFREIRIFNSSGLSHINSKTDIAVIGAGVGRKKRLEIMKAAECMKIRIANA